MHDLYLANQIIKIAKEYAQKNGLAKITKIVVELGEIIEHGENIKPENLKYNIGLLLPCKIEIKRVAGDKWKLVNIEGDRENNMSLKNYKIDSLLGIILILAFVILIGFLIWNSLRKEFPVRIDREAALEVQPSE